ncbi:iron-sulfur cluster assembly accessory protein [Methyloversatilis sp.]|uniref:HesB/IscA family protein n=1 Tax=Methyloversatilis sp. TaxID=2569862 RepID=UPI0027375008|nr:iron-sulfur cluster assembly accessory protein [Methyloversatilis sp.]MDP2870748.1 iron-sulfur cluster assembly accessory protein [Methyloversatilis sp.]MDP3286871.1 iron-sulfur cluster assembly accessory protein [Methyloversatilis sp.]MDP3455559.1 iron-sulfur cluster assembly accessory protein [Methyloversatilis sp.]MDP3578174.1 iron-sulfur cluster assembly accessory protein [Methyloversatilis sp.]
MTNVTLTPAAAKFMSRLVRFSGEPEGAGFRLQVSAGGCSGFNSEFTVESLPQAGDTVVDVSGVRMFLPAESRLLLEGVTIDFSDTPIKSGLTFINPNQAPCACSSSSTGTQATHSHASGHGDSHAMPGVVSVGIDAIRRG